MVNGKLVNFLLALLLLLTSVMLVIQEYGLNKEIIIDAQSDFTFVAVSDFTISGGKSIASVVVENDKIVLECEIVASNYAWPFCELSVLLQDKNLIPSEQGIDFSLFEHVSIYAQYENISPTGIRFQMRNLNEKYGSSNQQASWKYNGTEYWLDRASNPITIPLKSLQVATWWLSEYEVALEDSVPELDNIMQIELATGNNISPGKYRIIFEKLVFHGKIFKTRHVYMAIIIVWFVSGVFLLVSQLTRAHHQLKVSEKKSKELRKLNKLLNIESETLKEQVERDPLTGALNRSGIEAVFINEIPIISIAFIDIDHFKVVNDTYGHGVGDEVLQIFSRLISENSRDTDFLARWGGEEFLLVCPNTELKNLVDLSEVIRVLIEKYDWPQGIKLTASFGIAQKHKEQVSTFIERADKALYAAKARGRNRVIIAN